ncbi:MAG: TetR/AcrR family transcriptional regulator [Alphaproteobacteria bacterium]|nr:TetR/AcrR family transcriptional regulator [Alphaproteobacteria bacterium]
MTDVVVRPRPRLEARRRAFLEAAADAFLEKGYANTTLDDVIARSGGSRQTLYSLFGGKQGLFEAITQDCCDKIFGALTADAMVDRPPDEVLVELGTRLLEMVTMPQAVGLFRLVLAESASTRDLAEHFWRKGPGRTHALFGRYFRDQARRGVLRIADPEQAGQQFWGMLLGGFHIQCVLGLRAGPKPDEIEAFVRTAVVCFLNGCRARSVGSDGS